MHIQSKTASCPRHFIQTRRFVQLRKRVTENKYIEERGPSLPNVIIMGDFNFPNVNWHSGIISSAGKSVEEKRAGEQTREFLDSLCLTQTVNEPTRGENLLEWC